MLIEKPRLPIREILLYGFWPNSIKKIIYRLKGYRIGRGVSMGPGSVVIGKNVEIGDHTQLGFLTIIRGTTIKLGAHVTIGSTTILDTPHIEIGEGTRINEQVFVGGLQFPDSRLTVGRNCQIMQMSFINPARSITIGDDSGVGGHSLIFGHTSWLSQFEGYPVEFKDIEIGKSVSLAWRVFVLPGTRIGDGAVIGACSLVTREIPPRCLAIGFPARVVAQAPEFPKELDAEQKREILRNIVAEMARFFSLSGLTCTLDENRIVLIHGRRRFLRDRRQTWTLHVLYDGQPAVENLGRTDVLLSLPPIQPEVRRRLGDRDVLWIDLHHKERSCHSNDFGEEVILFLRRYGVRLFRVP